MGLDSLQNGLGVVKSNAGTIIAGGTGLAVGAALGASAVALTRRKKAKKNKRTSKRKSYSRKKRKRRNKYARTAGKRRNTSRKRIRMTKNGQPYVILKSGKARFIKKSSARNSRKRKGGRY